MLTSAPLLKLQDTHPNLSSTNQSCSQTTKLYTTRIEIGKSFCYLGRYFDFNMSDERHKAELCDDLFNKIISKIDDLPLHPRNKILLYSRYLLLKISWDLKEQCHCARILAKLEKNKMADDNERLHRSLKFKFGSEKLWPSRNLKILGNQCHNEILLYG